MITNAVKQSHIKVRFYSTLFFPQIVKDWEIIDDLHVETNTGGDNPPDMLAPGLCEGYLLKRRKWPLKGWHKVRKSPVCRCFFSFNAVLNEITRMYHVLLEVLRLRSWDFEILQKST